jgi:hypothetical protein
VTSSSALREVFYTVRGVVKNVVLETQKTVTMKWYAEEYLPRVVQAVKNISPRSRADTWFSTMKTLLSNAPKSAPSICQVLA